MRFVDRDRNLCAERDEQMKQMIERRDGCFNRKLDLLQVIQCVGSRVLLDVVVLPGLCPVPNSITKSQSELEVRIKNVHQVVRPFKIFSSERYFRAMSYKSCNDCMVALRDR